MRPISPAVYWLVMATISMAVLGACRSPLKNPNEGVDAAVAALLTARQVSGTEADRVIAYGDKAVDPLFAALGRSGNLLAEVRIGAALSRLDSPFLRKRVQELSGSADAQSRLKAVTAIIYLDAKEWSVPLLLQLSRDSDIAVKISAIGAFPRAAGIDVVEHRLVELLADENEATKVVAASVLADRKDPRALKVLLAFAASIDTASQANEPLLQLASIASIALYKFEGQQVKDAIHRLDELRARTRR